MSSKISGDGGMTQATADATYLKLSGVSTMTGPVKFANGANAINDADGSFIGYVQSVGLVVGDANSGGILRLNIQALSTTRVVTVPNVAGALVLGTATGTTVGAAGAASAMPTPLGYLTGTLPDGTLVKFPYFNV